MKNEAMVGSIIENLKDLEKAAKEAQALAKAKKFSAVVNKMIEAFHAIELSLDALQVATDSDDHGVSMAFTNLRSDLRLWRQGMEDLERMSESAADLAAEAIGEGEMPDNSIEELMLELLGRGMMVNVSPAGTPTRQSGIYVAPPAVVGDNSIGAGAVDVRLVSDGRWFESKIVAAADFLRKIKELPKGSSAKILWDASAAE